MGSISSFDRGTQVDENIKYHRIKHNCFKLETPYYFDYPEDIDRYLEFNERLLPVDKPRKSDIRMNFIITLTEKEEKLECTFDESYPGEFNLYVISKL